MVIDLKPFDKFYSPILCDERRIVICMLKQILLIWHDNLTAICNLSKFSYTPYTQLGDDHHQNFDS